MTQPSRSAGSACPDAAAAAAKLARRDLVVDLARVCCVLLVVVIHVLMIGVGLDASGAVVVSRPLEAQPWFAAATWFGQIMPLFFALGGFTALTSWRSLQRHGGDAWDFVRARTMRLAAPALPVFVLFAAVLGGATLAGVDPALVDTIATGAGSPLWFFAAYLLVQCLVPVAVRAHARAKWLALGGLAAGAVAVDAARIATGIDELGLVNLVFVWGFAQQLGFWYADGWFRRRTAPQLVALAAVAYLLVRFGVDAGWYSPDMLVNLNPPTVPLALLGIAQVALLTLLAPLLRALMQRRAAQAAVFAVGSRTMTIYLWHLPVIVAVAGLTLLIPGAAPEPASAGWWWSRPLVFVVVLAIVWAVSLPLRRFEQVSVAIPEGRRRPGALAVAAAAVLAFVPPFLVMQLFLDLPIALVGVVLLAAALVLERPRSRSTARSSSNARA
ncbi:acyltransferase family protein [Agromyces sp. CFH 90414]|uniref:Acyltransferase family protein n=1 Tax=Agromyces agglutinans TaxID=2662258 RepID=A0A6I2F3R7_9MICO|nr:acyltransferase [Agromyces agglutinans]MRG58871.1 acyltransferase family protein [Agromyces agglutinans]